MRQHTTHRRRGRLLAFTLSLGLVLAATVGRHAGGANANVSPDASPQFLAIASAVEAAMLKDNVPGAAVGIFANGRQEVATLGLANLETREAVTNETRFQIGSNTKTYTATALMHLVEQGKVDLDSPVRRYLPDFRVADDKASERVTVRNLLQHTGGWWGDYFVDSSAGPDAMQRYIADVMPGLPQIAPVGTRVSYNNSGTLTAGRIVEVVGGKPYREMIEELVLRPLRLNSATYDPSVVETIPHSLGYGEGPSGMEPITPLFVPRSVEAAGALWASIDDQMRYMRFQMGDPASDAPGVLRPETRRLMQTPQRDFADPGLGSIGLQWIISDAGGLRRVEHGGATFAQRSNMVFFPERQVGVVILTNSQNADGVINAGVNGLIAEFISRDAKRPLSEAPLPASVLEQYTGNFGTPFQTFTVAWQDDHLSLSAAGHPLKDQVMPSNDTGAIPTVRLTFVAHDRAVLGSVDQPGASLTFLRRADGSIGWVALGGRLVARLD